MLRSIVPLVLFGLIVGLLTRHFSKGPTDFWEISGVGMAGSVIGGLIAQGLGWTSTAWSFASIALALLSAMLLITVARAIHGTP